MYSREWMAKMRRREARKKKRTASGFFTLEEEVKP